MYFLFTKFEKSSFWASEALLSLDWKKIIKSYFLYQGLKAYLVCRLFDIHAASIVTYSFWKIIIVLAYFVVFVCFCIQSFWLNRVSR